MILFCPKSPHFSILSLFQSSDSNTNMNVVVICRHAVNNIKCSVSTVPYESNLARADLDADRGKLSFRPDLAANRLLSPFSLRPPGAYIRPHHPCYPHSWYAAGTRLLPSSCSVYECCSAPSDRNVTGFCVPYSIVINRRIQECAP